MADHTQTGSISFEAVGGFSSYASGQFTTTEDVAQMSQPNLSPFFSHPLTDIYNAETNPDGYWANNLTGGSSPLTDGWNHYEFSNTASDTRWLTIYEHCAWRHANGDLKGDTDYTVLMEFRNVTKTGNVTASGITTHPSSWPSMFRTMPAAQQITEGAALYFTSKTVADPSSITGDSVSTRTLLNIPAGASISCDLRVSLYEGEYSGPYKPYVDQSLITRVSTAETAIEQNAEAITLRATKTEAQQMAQPNLSPWFSAGVPSLPSTYWKYARGTKPTMTDMGDGWVRMRLDNSAGTGTVRFDYDPVAAEGVECGKDYTLLFELRNVGGSGDARVYTVQMGDYGAQFWGAGVNTLLQGYMVDATIRLDYTAAQAGSNYGWAELCDDGVYRKRVVKKSEASDSQYWTRSDDKRCVRLVAFATAGAVFDAELRFSIYPGTYEGPYKPYSGTQLYASQAQLKVANDAITSKVSTTDYNGQTIASLINQSADTVKIQAQHVEIDGTTTFTSGTTLADYVEGKAQDAADSVVVGGRNLLRRTATPFSYAINTTNYSTHHLYSTGSTDTAYDGPTLEELGFAVGDEVTFTFDWKTSQNGSTAIRYGSFRIEYYGVTSSGTNGYITRMGDVVTMSESNASGHFVRTATLTAATIKTQRMVVRVDNSALVFAVSNAKLEKGNHATDWTPAPEDVTSRTQRIYYRTSSSTAPTSQYMPTAWVTETGDKWAANSTTVANWTAKATKLTNGSGTKYPYLFTCEQRQMADGTLAYTTVLLDETTTVIDGGSIITNSIDANKLTVYDATIGKIKADAIDVSAIKIGDLDGASTVVSNAANGKSAYDRHTAYRGTCSTAAGTADKVVACTGFALATGATVEVYCSTANTANVPTLNVNSTGAKPIWINGAVASASNPCKWLAGDTVTFTYDGTRFRASLPVEGYVTEGTGGGLMVHRKSDATTGVQITDDVDIVRNGSVMTRVDENGMTLYDGNGTADANVVASFGEDLIELGKGSEDAVIKLCNGVATMSVENFEFIFRRVGGYLTLKTVPSANAATYSRIQLDSGTLSLETYSENEDLHAAVNVTSLSGHDPRVQIRGILELDTPLADAYIDSVSTSKLNGTIPTSKLDGTIATSKLDGTIADTNLPTKGSAGTAGTSSATSGATLAVPYITTDAYGRVTAKGTHTHTIGSLAASAVTSGTFDDARIPNLNASKINDGTLDSARLPTVPVDKGGTGQTGVEKTTDIAAAMSAASGVTISAAQVATWGKVMQVLITAKATAAKSGTWTVGTMTAGHRPELVTFGTSNLAAIEQCRMGTDGAVSVAGTLAANASVSLTFTYLLA